LIITPSVRFHAGHFNRWRGLFKVAHGSDFHDILCGTGTDKVYHNTLKRYTEALEIIEDHEVDPEFGTGVVMVCTYGDKTDVRWVKHHRLSVIKAVDELGRMTEASEKYAGMTLEECKREIIEDLRKAGILVKQEKLTQSIGVCWRCDTPVIQKKMEQWFLKITAYAEELLDFSHIDWPERVVALQTNWIGRSEGASVIFKTEAGNHDVEFDERIFGQALQYYLLQNMKAPRFQNRGLLNLGVGNEIYTLYLFHKSRFRSVFRPAHGAYREYQFGYPADV
jgi:hypothetical protein